MRISQVLCQAAQAEFSSWIQNESGCSEKQIKAIESKTEKLFNKISSGKETKEVFAKYKKFIREKTDCSKELRKEIKETVNTFRQLDKKADRLFRKVNTDGKPVEKACASLTKWLSKKELSSNLQSTILDAFKKEMPKPKENEKIVLQQKSDLKTSMNEPIVIEEEISTILQIEENKESINQELPAVIVQQEETLVTNDQVLEKQDEESKEIINQEIPLTIVQQEETLVANDQVLEKQDEESKEIIHEELASVIVQQEETLVANDQVLEKQDEESKEIIHEELASVIVQQEETLVANNQVLEKQDEESKEIINQELASVIIQQEETIQTGPRIEDITNQETPVEQKNEGTTTTTVEENVPHIEQPTQPVVQPQPNFFQRFFNTGKK